MIHHSNLSAPRRSSALVLLLAGILLVAPNICRADGDLVSKRGVVRRTVQPPAAAPSIDPRGDRVPIDDPPPSRRSHRIPEEVTPGAAPTACTPEAAATGESTGAGALLRYWSDFWSRLANR